MIKEGVLLIIKEDYKYSDMKIEYKENMMKVVISDYPYILARDLEYEISILKRVKDIDVVIYEYTGDKEEFGNIIL